MNLSKGTYYDRLNGNSTIKDLETLFQLNYLYFTSIKKDEKSVASLMGLLERLTLWGLPDLWARPIATWPHMAAGTSREFRRLPGLKDWGRLRLTRPQKHCKTHIFRLWSNKRTREA